MKTIEERFWAKVDKSGDCWTWQAATIPSGYGYFGVDGKMSYAHRLSYEWANPGGLDGLEVDHICHTRSCVRPDHLRAVTRKQNCENLSGAMTNSRSGLRGVSWHKRAGKWQVHVNHDGTKHYLGLFADKAGANAAAIAKRNELFTHNEMDRAA